MRYDVAIPKHQQEPAMATMPTPVAELLERALVGELTVVDATGRPVTYPLIPLYDGEQAVHDLVDAVQPQAASTSTPTRRSRSPSPTRSRSAVGPTEPRSRATPASSTRTRTAAGSDCSRSGRRRSPRSSTSSRSGSRCRLFFERALIEITPRRVLYWSDGSAAATRRRSRPSARRPRDACDRRRPQHARARCPRPGSSKLATYPFQIATWVDDDGYPVSVAVEADHRPGRG